MGRRKNLSMPVQQIRVRINDQTESFALRRELLPSRATAMARIARFRDHATRVLKEIQDSKDKRQEDTAEFVPLSPDLSFSRSPIEWSVDAPQPSVRGSQEQLDERTFMLEFTWLSSDAA
jgi:hypothetical protein